MNFKDIQDIVILRTHQPGLVDVIKGRINAVVKFISMSGFYYPDLKEVIYGSGEGVNATIYTQSLTIPARFRKMEYVKYPSGVSAREYLRGYTSTHLAIEEAKYLSDVYYISGNTIKIRQGTKTSSILLGYYDYPATLVVDTDTNWVLNYADQVVADQVTQFIMSATGNREEAGVYGNFSQAQLQAVISGLLDTVNTNLSHGL